ncbi:MAG: acyl-CoA thioester hydrolase [Bacteroidia bacterium]
MTKRRTALQEFAITITPRMYETDAMGHINNATIAAWFEVVRVRFLESLAGAEPGLNKNWILASVHIDFVGETFYGADVTAKIVSAKVGNTSLTLETAMAQGDRQTVTGRAVLVAMDYTTKTPQRISDAIREDIASR